MIKRVLDFKEQMQVLPDTIRQYITNAEAVAGDDLKRCRRIIRGQYRSFRRGATASSTRSFILIVNIRSHYGPGNRETHRNPSPNQTPDGSESLRAAQRSYI